MKGNGTGNVIRVPGSAPLGGDLATLCDQQAGGGFASSAGAAHRAGGATEYAAAERARRSQEDVGRCGQRSPGILPNSNTANTGGAARCSRNSAESPGGRNEVRSPETRKLLCLTERRAEGEFQYHGFATAQPSEQWPVDCSRFHIGGPSGLATCDAIFARCLVRVTPTEIGRPSSVRTRRQIALAISATEEMGASRDIAKSLIDRDTLDERCKIIEHLDGGIA